MGRIPSLMVFPVFGLLLFQHSAAGWPLFPDLPDGLAFKGDAHPASEVVFLYDLTGVDAMGERQVEQQIFDEVSRMVDRARDFILLDFFLFNRFGYEPGPGLRPLSDELTERLITRKQEHPGLSVLFITDPINTVYGGQVAPHLVALEQAGIRVVLTDLDRLRDSNPLWSVPWRLLIRPLGVQEGSLLPNPLGEGRMSVRALLKTFNFKANHRKLIVADELGAWPVALITSANPHDASSAHGNVAVRFDGPAVYDLIATEQSVLRFSGAELFPEPRSVHFQTVSPLTVQVLTERRIKEAALEALAVAGPGTRIDLVMFYFSDADLREAFIAAHRRGADLRILLDPNRDAFGLEKSGVPNRQTAYAFHQAGIAVRWAATHGEQCHGKMLLVRSPDGNAVLIAGSANYTRRNLDNFNLETNVAVRGPADAACFEQVRTFFETLWSNRPGCIYSMDYETYRDHSPLKVIRARFQERTGLSAF